MNSWCVYMHIAPNNKKYIGITSRKPEERWKNGKGYNHNQHFFSAIKKYGWNNFKHIVLFSNLSEEQACRLEQLCIILFKSYYREYGYNKTFGGDTPKHSPDHIQPNARKIFCLETNQIYNSLAEAQRVFGFSTYTGILENCSGKYKHTHGYHFCYLENKEELLKQNKDFLNKNDKRVYCFTNNTIYGSTGEAAKATNTPLRTIQRRCTNKDTKITKTGFSFCYYRDFILGG